MVRSGYKQTQVGVIPEDWNVSTLGSVCSFENGDRGENYPSPGSFVASGVPFVNAGHMSKGHVSLEHMDYISKEAYDRLGGGKCIPGDILFCLRGSLGKYGIVEADLPIGAIASSLVIVRPRLSVLGFRFLGQYFASSICNQMIEKWAGGAAQPNLGANDLGRFRIPIPPTKAEQEAIAGALSDADALIESLEGLIGKTRQIKQGAMQELLTGNTRLPGFESENGFKESDVGVIPKDWEIRRLGELFTIASSKRVFQSEWRSAGVPFYRARELAVLGEQGTVENELFISEALYTSHKKKHGVPKMGDILVTGVGTLGKTYVVPDDHEFYFKDGNIIWFQMTEDISSGFLNQLFATRLIAKQIQNASSGTTVGTYTISGAKETVIPYPSVSEQFAIAAALSDMDAEIAVLGTKLAKARQIKQGMMQELLTGRIRLVSGELKMENGE